MNKYKWWILGGIFLVFAVAVGFLRKRAVAGTAHPLPAQTAAPSAATGANNLLTALKDELFALETDRAQGRISEAEYGELRSALELALRRAPSRHPA